MTQSIDIRTADGNDTPTTIPSTAGTQAMRNVAYLDGNPGVHVPGQATKTGFAAIKLTAKSSGRFRVAMLSKHAAVAADDVTLTVDVYTDAVAGTPLTLPANALAQGTNCYVDNGGQGIAPSAGATAAHTVTAPDQTLGTAAAAAVLEFAGEVQLAAGGVPVGQTFYCVFSVTNSVAARSISQLFLSAQELP